MSINIRCFVGSMLIAIGGFSVALAETAADTSRQQAPIQLQIVVTDDSAETQAEYQDAPVYCNIHLPDRPTSIGDTLLVVLTYSFEGKPDCANDALYQASIMITRPDGTHRLHKSALLKYKAGLSSIFVASRSITLAGEYKVSGGVAVCPKQLVLADINSGEFPFDYAAFATEKIVTISSDSSSLHQAYEAGDD